MSRSLKRVCISGSVRKLHATSSCVSLRFEGRAERGSTWFPRQHTTLLMAVPAAPLRAVFGLSSDGSSHSLKWFQPLSHDAEFLCSTRDHSRDVRLFPDISPGLTWFVSESQVQMVKEGDVTLGSQQKQLQQREYLIYRHPCGPVQVSTGPHLPAHPSGRWGGLISRSHGEVLWP